MTPDAKSVAARDLSRHLDQRLTTLFSDFMERCSAVGIDYDEATARALTIAGHYAAAAALGVNCTEAEYVQLCRWQYRQGVKILKAAEG